MPDIVYPSTLTNHTLADADEVMALFNAITAQVNGNIAGAGTAPGDENIPADTITAREIAPLTVTNAEVANSTLTDGKLVSPNNSIYRTIHHASGGDSNHSYLSSANLVIAKGVLQSSFDCTIGIETFRLVAADYGPPSGKTTKLRLRAQLMVGASAPPTGVTVGLYPITSISGENLVLGGIAGAAINFGSPAANSRVDGVNADFNFPADGYYVIQAITPAGFVDYTLSYQLQLHHV